MQIICAACGHEISLGKCPKCGSDPLLKSRYALCELLGQGASGQTYKAFDQKTKEMVAIKELPWRLGEENKTKTRFMREAETLRQLSHKNIPRFIEDFVSQEGRRWTLHIVQEYIEGKTLLQKVSSERLSQEEVWNIGESVLDIIAELHEMAPPVIHRDIKPANIIERDSDGRHFLIDFGSVKDALSDIQLGSSTFAGTFGYMAPEQHQGHAGPRTDLYSVGALLIRLLTREEPSSLLDHRLQIHWHQRLNLPKALGVFLDKLCDPNPEKRWPSARTALSMLRAARNPETQPSPEETEPPVIWLDAFRNIMRQELQDGLKHQAPMPVVNIKEDPQEISLPVFTKEIHSENMNINELLVGVPEHKRGWWKAKPPTPVEKRSEPTHPATQLIMMSGLFLGVTVLLQLILF